MLSIEIEREEDGRWSGAVPELPGVLAYGATEAEARAKTTALALRVIADPIEHGEAVPFHDNEEIGPRMLARIAKATGLRPEDL